MNWGSGIVIGLVAFMLFIVSSVVYMTNKNTDTLDDQDYYERGLNYDEVYALRQNLQKDGATPLLKMLRDTLFIEFAKNGSSGEMVWKRPSDQSMDRTLPFTTDTEMITVPLLLFEKGNWKLELRWSSMGRDYLSEHAVFVQ